MNRKFCKIIYNVLNYNKIVTISQPKSLHDKLKFGWQLFYGTLYNVYHFISQGTQSCYQDYQLKRKFGENKSCYQFYQEYHIKRELDKVIPFLLLFLFPGSTALLPVYASLLPNAIPTNYLFEQQYQQRLQRKQKLQQQATHQLFQHQNLIQNARTADQLKEQFITKKHLFEKKYHLENLNSDQLNLICQHLTMEYLSLNYVFNKIYHFVFNIHNYCYNFWQFVREQSRRRNYIDPYKIINIQRPFFIEFARKKLLIYQIEDYFNYLNVQDEVYYVKDQHYYNYAAERGITKKRLTQDEYNNDWIRFTQQNQLTISQKIWFSVLYSQLQ